MEENLQEEVVDTTQELEQVENSSDVIESSETENEVSPIDYHSSDYDDINYFSEKQDEPKTFSESTSDGDIVRLSKSEYESLRTASEQLRSLQSNPAAQALLNWTQQGKPVEEFLSNQDLVVDYNKLPAKEIYRKSLEQMGRFSKESIESKIEAFDDLDEIEQEERVYEKRQQFIRTQQEKLSEFNKGLSQNQETQRRLAQKFDQDWSDVCSKWEQRGEWYGVPYTKEDSKAITEMIAKNQFWRIFQNPDGSFNAAKVHRAILAMEKLPDVASQAKKSASQKAAEKFIKENQAVPDKTISSNSSVLATPGSDDGYRKWLEKRMGASKEQTENKQNFEIKKPKNN